MKKKIGQNIVRIPPQDIDAEKALLGSIMVRPAGIHDIMDTIRSESFYADKHGIIYREMVDLVSRNEPIDLVSLTARLRDRKVLDSIGGTDYLNELVTMVPASTNVSHYADIVAKKYTLRGLISAGDDISELGYEEAQEIEAVLDTAEKRVMEVTNSSGKTKHFSSAREILPHVYETIQHLMDNQHELRGVPTGFPTLDAKLLGFQKNDLIILAARPSVGKTSLALDFARLAAVKHNIPVGIFSLEMSQESLFDRMISAQANVEAWKMKKGAINEDESLRITDAVSVLMNAPIFVDDQAGNSILRMRSAARRLKREHGLGLIIIDYLQLVTTSKNYDSMVNQVTEISRSLKSLARELEVPVIALSQLSRQAAQGNEKPQLHHLRDSGSIEQDADVVMFIHRDKNEDGGRHSRTELLIEKHRNGATGVVYFEFDGSKTTFVEAATENQFASYSNEKSSSYVDDNF